MDTAVCTVVRMSENGGGDLNLICKVMNLKNKQKLLLHKVLDASDEWQEIIDVLLSSKNTVLDLVQRISRANNEGLSLMREITNCNSTECDLFRRVIHLCEGKKYFMYKFMDWYLNDMSLSFSCSCSEVQGAESAGKNGPCKLKKWNDTVVSGCATRQGNSSENFMPHQPNQDTSTQKLGKSCRENGPSLSETDARTENGSSLSEPDARTENRSTTEQVNLTEKDDSSAEAVARLAQPTVNCSLSNERLCSDGSQSSKDIGTSVLHFEHSDCGSKQKPMEKLDYARVNGNSTSTVTVVHGASNTREDVTGAHGGVSLNTKSAIPPGKNMEVREEQTLALGTNRKSHSRRAKESVWELPNVGTRGAVKLLLPKQDTDVQVIEQQIYDGSSGVLTPCSSAVENTGIQSQNDTVNDRCFPGSGSIETQPQPSAKVLIKASDKIVIKDCYIKLENMADVLGSKQTVHLKDLERFRGKGTTKTTSEKKVSDDTDCDFKAFSNGLPRSKRKQDMRQRCYVNNTKKSRTQTSEELGFQENRGHVREDNEAVTLKDMEMTQQISMKDSVTEINLPGFGFKGFDNTALSKRKKRETAVRCYTNNTLKRMQTSKRLDSQDGTAKKKMAVQCSDLEDSERDNGKICSGFSNDTANSKNQNLNSTDVRTPQLTRDEVIPEGTQVVGRRRQRKDRVPEIHNPEVTRREDSSSQNIEDVQVNAVFLGHMANYEGSSGICVGETSGIRLRVKPEYSERTGMLWRPLSREAEKENILGIQLQPLSLERVGSLKWAQFTTYIDHPYAEVNYRGTT